MFRFSCLILAITFILSPLSGVQAGLLNGDFSDSTLADAGGGGAPIPYSAVDGGWWAKSRDTDWTISGGQLTQIGRSGSETRVAQFFTNDMTGDGWSLELTLGTSGNATGADDILVWGGVDDGNNSPGDTIKGLNNESLPSAAIGTWTTLVNLTDVPANGLVSAEITEDLSQYDLIGVMITQRNSNGPATLTIDDVQFVNALVPEPRSVALWLLLATIGLTYHCTARRRGLGAVSSARVA